jgi:hypothetical protein
MGRSVIYLDNAEVVLYFPIENEYNEAGEFDEDLSQMIWDDMIDNLTCEIKKRLPSYYEVKDKWGNRETRIILENSLCSIGISEYCGLVSLSVAPRENESDEWHERFAIRHANNIKNTLEKVLSDLGLKNLHKVGTFSNGEAVFELAK